MDRFASVNRSNQ
ncbi:Protein of unknown function [Lactobacillus helveticus CIRM-BIA 104]|uniref:Uncharacterized protein n=1 Tax=Lactobacillus helveticus CIRM-BIA 104 TaxID=1226333 RepID=U6FAC9_LACHE|nr:Protein of unknown function [Lactobacillus helveticus CIRM-BIA 104]